MIAIPDGAVLTREHALELLGQMLRIRQFEDRCAQLYTEQKIRGFLHLYNGEEAIAVGVMQTLGADDAVVATYREHGHALARGVPMNALMAEMYGKSSGSSQSKKSSGSGSGGNKAQKAAAGRKGGKKSS